MILLNESEPQTVLVTPRGSDRNEPVAEARMATESICKIEGCDKPTCNVRGWCKLHYGRWIRHGDPLMLKKPYRAYHLKCSVEDCDEPVKSLGYCGSHYKRLLRYGDPLGGSTGWGAVRKWLDQIAVPHEKDECLVFPFSKDGHGYGRINIGGKYVGAHVYVAERCIGPKPSDRHEVCHTCGNGNQGCVAKAHLYWGTRKENVQDAMKHGTFSAPPIGMRGKGKRK